MTECSLGVYLIPSLDSSAGEVEVFLIPELNHLLLVIFLLVVELQLLGPCGLHLQQLGKRCLHLQQL